MAISGQNRLSTARGVFASALLAAVLAATAWAGALFIKTLSDQTFGPFDSPKVSHAEKAIPAIFGSLRLVVMNDANHLLVLGNTDNTRCGGALFELTPEATAAVAAGGLPGLAAATQSRGLAGRGGQIPITYEWQRTPIPTGFHVEGLYVPGYQCMDSRFLLGDLIRDATDGPAGFFAHGDDAQLLFIPDRQLLLYTYE